MGWQIAVSALRNAPVAGTIDLSVALPDAEAHRLEGQRVVIADSLVKLAALAEAGC